MGRTPRPDRREVIAGAATIAVAMVVPTMPASIGPSFVAMQARLDRAMSTLNAAREAAVAARPQIFEGMRQSKRKIDAFFGAPEIKARARARMEAQAAAEEIIFAPATNDAEIALQAKTKELFMTQLGGDITPPSRPPARDVQEST